MQQLSTYGFIMSPYYRLYYTILYVGPPEFTRLPQNTTIAIGKNVTLHCSFEAIPPGVREWEKISHSGMQTKIDPTYSGRYQIADNGNLIISTTSGEDNGQYSCTISNALGSVSEVIQLTVISKFINIINSLFCSAFIFKNLKW